MGSGINYFSMSSWGQLISETILTANANTIDISIPNQGYKYLHIFMNVTSTEAAAGDWVIMQFSTDGSDTWRGTASYQNIPDILSVGAIISNACDMPLMGDNTQNLWVEIIILADPAITVKQLSSSALCPANSALYTNKSYCILGAGSTISILHFEAQNEFKAGSRITVYGLN